MFSKSKTNNPNPAVQSLPVAPAPVAPVQLTDSSDSLAQAQPQRNNMMDIISSNASKPSILSEGFSFRGEISAKGAIHVEGSLNGQVQVDELTIGSRGQVEGVVTCSSLHIKGKFSGTATCSELIVTSSASVDGHVVYQTLSVQKGASIKGELLLVK
ncbi:MAG: polymer-forming cytoskeletal protein [Betaproteobacteria bacterium]|nr:polymer-forming cytoskeletal protein [Betaproteobacteria bacterium]NBY33032.1 polymer-forming cytoskeletal protein [Betaproteobacteria bacterium]NDF05797.1 polymer-forming cytoskeletal protein [Betaproteobacteria bacterium]